jgi:hypothetical protein
MSAPEPTVLDYASPTLRVPRRRVSFYLGLSVCCLGAFAAWFIPSTVGSGITYRNPDAAAAAYLIWLASIVYIWLRAFDERPRSRLLAGFIALCGTVAVIAVPMQLDAWDGDPGHPQPRFRLALLWPGIIAGVAVLGAAFGRVLTRRCSGPAGTVS